MRWICLALLGACTEEKEGARTGPAGGGDSAGAEDSGGDSGAPAPTGCRADPGSADRERLVMVSAPYTSGGGQSPLWRAWRLDLEGALEPTGQEVELGRAWQGRMVFSPDGSLGVAPLDDGSLGIIAVDEELGVTVVEAGWTDGFYAGPLAFDPSGELLWLVDGNWPNNGGGLYRLPLDCETGAPGPSERIAEARLPAGIQLDGDRGLLVGVEVPGAPEGADLALVDLSTGEAMGGLDLFGHDEAIVSDSAWHGQEGLLLVGDHDEFSGRANSIAIAQVLGVSPVLLGTVEVLDPFSLLFAPDGSSALVVSGYGDSLYSLDPYAAELTELDYRGAGPQLPGAAVSLGRGALAGLALVAEVEGIRQVDLSTMTDLGLTSTGPGLEDMPGALGIQP